MTTALVGGEGSASRPGRPLPPGKTRYPLYRRLGGPQGRSGQVRKISLPPEFDPRTIPFLNHKLFLLKFEVTHTHTHTHTQSTSDIAPLSAHRNLCWQIQVAYCIIENILFCKLPLVLSEGDAISGYIYVNIHIHQPI